MDKSIINYVQSKDIISDLQSIIEQSQKVAHSAVNVVLIQRNWLMGKRIFEKEYPDIFQSLIGKSETLLTWTHYLTLLQMETNKCLHQNTNYIYLVKKS